MRYRRFGSTDLTVSEVGFGCTRIGGLFQGSSRSEMVDLLRRAMAAGITFFDTADMYTQGESERLVGEAARSNRDRVVIATKFGYRLPKQKQLITRVKPLLRPLVSRLGLRAHQVHIGLRGAVSQQDFSPAHVVRAAEASLRRLNTDYIDLYQLHDPPIDVVRAGEFIDALELLRQQGKIRHWGVSCQHAEDALECFAHPSLTSIQVGLSVLEQDALGAAIPGAVERGIAVVARQVFASGLLTRRLEALKLDDLDSDPQAAQRKYQELTAYALIAERCGRNRAEMALKFALARQEVSVVLLGISQTSQLEAGLKALEAAKLSAEEEQLLLAPLVNQAGDPGAIRAAESTISQPAPKASH
jgi:aryl-alcohol dehydrogenase-like predicted oxidoreductase